MSAWLGLTAMIAVMGAALFVSAGTIRYCEAWIYLGIFLGACVWLTAYLMKHDPALLQRRVKSGPLAEARRAQQIIMSVAAAAFIGMLFVPAIDHRFGWSALPPYAIIIGDVLTLVAFGVIFLVYRENSFTSATIEVASDQRVVSSGPYAFVRHPMYAGALLLFVGTPLALGSAWGLLASALGVTMMTLRLFDEERYLSENLPGYPAYCSAVRWRLIPGLF